MMDKILCGLFGLVLGLSLAASRGCRDVSADQIQACTAGCAGHMQAVSMERCECQTAGLGIPRDGGGPR